MKDYKKKIHKFRRKIRLEAGLRAGSIGVSAGLAVMAALLLYGRLSYQTIMLSKAAVAAVVAGLLIALLCYVIRFRPKKKEVLARIDSLGLQERIITMEELKQSDTLIAKKQRQDARTQLEKLENSALGIRFYIWPLVCSLLLAMIACVLIFVPFPEKEEDPLAVQNAKEMAIVDELITALTETVAQSDVLESMKTDLQEIVDALAINFTPEDSTLTRTAKIATASKRLDMYEGEQQNELMLLKQQLDGSEEMKLQVTEATEEQFKLSHVIKKMKDLMGTSIEVLNMVEGTFWAPGGPSSGTSYDVEELPMEEEPPEGENPEEQEPGEGEQPPEGMEPGENGEPQEGMEGEFAGMGSETIFDPEQGEVSYGSVYEEYYQAILKALTEREYSEEIREMIEDYANSLE